MTYSKSGKREMTYSKSSNRESDDGVELFLPIVLEREREREGGWSMA